MGNTTHKALKQSAQPMIKPLEILMSPIEQPG